MSTIAFTTQLGKVNFADLKKREAVADTGATFFTVQLLLANIPHIITTANGGTIGAGEMTGSRLGFLAQQGQLVMKSRC